MGPSEAFKCVRTLYLLPLNENSNKFSIVIQFLFKMHAFILFLDFFQATHKARAFFSHFLLCHFTLNSATRTYVVGSYTYYDALHFRNCNNLNTASVDLFNNC